jgi:hypothetical protein
MRTSRANSAAEKTRKNSAKELKIKMEVEELKSNLMKERHIGKSESRYNPHDTLCNQEVSNFEGEESTLKGTLRSMLDIKKGNQIIAKDVIVLIILTFLLGKTKKHFKQRKNYFTAA